MKFHVEFRRVLTTTAHVEAASFEEAQAAAKAETVDDTEWFVEQEPPDGWDVTVREAGDDLDCETVVRDGKLAHRDDVGED